MCTGEFNSVITDTIINMKNVNTRSQSHYLFFLGEATQNENEEENEGSSRPGGGYRPGGSQSQSSSTLPSRTPAGDGVIVNPQITYSNNSDSDTYKQFTHSYN
jgi:hypothetical protein